MNARPLPIGLLAALTLSSGSIAAKDFKCDKLIDCMELAFELNGDKYYSANDLKGKVAMINTKIDKNNVDRVLSNILYDNGYLRIKEDEGQYRVINARNARYNTFPIVSVSEDRAPKLPNNSDFYMMEYKVKHPKSTRVVTKNLRPFLSRYGRVVSPSGTDRIIVQDTSKNINRVYSLVRSFDQEIDSETMRKIEQREKRHHAVRLAKTRKCSHEKLQ